MELVLFDLISLNFNFDNDKGTSYNCIASTAILCTSHFTPLHLVAKQSVSISPFHSLPMYFVSSHLISYLHLRILSLPKHSCHIHPSVHSNDSLQNLLLQFSTYVQDSIHPPINNQSIKNTQYANQINSPIPSIPAYLQILPCLTNPTQDKIRAYQNCTVPPFNSIQQHRELPHTTLFICKLQVLTSSHLPKENITTAIHPIINTMPKAFIQTTSF